MFNIDPRSSFINMELIVIIGSKLFYEVLGKEMQQDLAYNLEVETDSNYSDDAVLSPDHIASF